MAAIKAKIKLHIYLSFSRQILTMKQIIEGQSPKSWNFSFFQPLRRKFNSKLY